MRAYLTDALAGSIPTVEHSVVHVGASTRVVLDGLTDSAGAYIAGATVTIESFVDDAGVAVSGLTVPAAMAASGASPMDGAYSRTLPSTIGVTEDKWYTLTIKAINTGTSPNQVLLIAERVYADVRRA